MESINFCGLTFSGLDRKKILSNDSYFQQIVTVGAEFIIEAQKNPRLKEIINKNTSTFDGQVPYLLANLKNNGTSFEKISGADFIYDICEKALHQKERIFLLGGNEISNPASVKRMKEMGIEAEGLVTGFIPYPFPEDRLKAILEKIKEFQPTYLFVGLGMCKQEYFIDENRRFLEQNGVKIAVGSGGTFEVFSGTIKRAPKWMQKMGLEGVFRVFTDPSLKRLRRLLSTIKFIKYI
ncbi:MAG: WecB/TagA/CpsF family glycosyltransferase [Muribaculaceae bacterium]|nr:WecB/TagA/CpsF family glycosyltransferase [Muribaculaceae bacterium]